jgi:hypothetical protein
LLAGGERERASQSGVRVPMEQVSRPDPASSIPDFRFALVSSAPPRLALSCVFFSGVKFGFCVCRGGVEKLGG